MIFYRCLVAGLVFTTSKLGVGCVMRTSGTQCRVVISTERRTRGRSSVAVPHVAIGERSKGFRRPMRASSLRDSKKA